MLDEQILKPFKNHQLFKEFTDLIQQPVTNEITQ